MVCWIQAELWPVGSAAEPGHELRFCSADRGCLRMDLWLLHVDCRGTADVLHWGAFRAFGSPAGGRTRAETLLWSLDDHGLMWPNQTVQSGPEPSCDQSLEAQTGEPDNHLRPAGGPCAECLSADALLPPSSLWQECVTQPPDSRDSDRSWTRAVKPQSNWSSEEEDYSETIRRSAVLTGDHLNEPFRETLKGSHLRFCRSHKRDQMIRVGLEHERLLTSWTTFDLCWTLRKWTAFHLKLLLVETCNTSVHLKIKSEIQSNGESEPDVQVKVQFSIHTCSGVRSSDCLWDHVRNSFLSFFISCTGPCRFLGNIPIIPSQIPDSASGLGEFQWKVAVVQCLHCLNSNLCRGCSCFTDCWFLRNPAVLFLLPSFSVFKDFY